MNAPNDLKYTNEHEWLRIEGNIAVVGITDYAQGELGDIVFVELPAVGDEVKAHSSFGTIEAVKAVSDIFSPLTGKIVEINGLLEDDPMIINRNPYDDGWLVKIEFSNESELSEFLTADEYRSKIE